MTPPYSESDLEKAVSIFMADETADLKPPYRCLPKGDAEWITAKTKRFATALSTLRQEKDGEIARFKKAESDLDSQLAIQLKEPSVNTDAYMAGLLNGMLLAKANFDGQKGTYAPVSYVDAEKASLRSQLASKDVEVKGTQDISNSWQRRALLAEQRLASTEIRVREECAKKADSPYQDCCGETARSIAQAIRQRSSK